MTSVRTVNTNRSAKQFARGHRGGILTTSIPASAMTASNEAVNARTTTASARAVQREAAATELRAGVQRRCLLRPATAYRAATGPRRSDRP